MGERQTVIFTNTAGEAMGHGTTKNQKAQNLIEYALVVSIISAGAFAMSTYVFRSVQSTQKVITEEFARE